MINSRGLIHLVKLLSVSKTMVQENGAKLIWLNVIEVQSRQRGSSEFRTTSFKVFWDPFQYSQG